MQGPDNALFRPNVPEDFDAFWQELVEEQKIEPLDYHRSLRNDFDLAGFIIETLTFRGMHGSPLHGWIAYPDGARRLPSFLWIPPYGRESTTATLQPACRHFVATTDPPAPVPTTTRSNRCVMTPSLRVNGRQPPDRE